MELLETRLSFLLFGIMLLAVSTLAPVEATALTDDEKRSVKNPNIVIIFADDLGFNDVSFHGSSQIPTPNLDKLAHQGIIFSRFYAQSKCSPSRSALMTGKYPFKIGMQKNAIQPGSPWGLPLNIKILPQYLKDLGYSTHLVGKWHLGEHRTSYLPTNRGFDTFLGTPAGIVDHYGYGIFGKGYSLFNGTQPLREINNSDRYLPDRIASWAKSIIDEQSYSSKPFFLFVSSVAPHGGANKLNNQGMDNLQTSPHYLNRTAVRAITNSNRRKYAAMVQAVDETVATVYNALVNNNVANNTVLWFQSDNGGSYPVPGTYAPEPPASNWPLRGCKGTLWEGGVRVPAFLVASPTLMNRTAGISNQLFHVGDLLPTLIEIAGGNSSSIPNIDGVNQWDALRNPDQPAPRSELMLDIYNEFSPPHFAAIKGNYKIIAGFFHEGAPDGNSWLRPLGTSVENPQRENVSAAVDCNFSKNENGTTCDPNVGPCLFDLIEDPCELNNLATSRLDVLEDLLDFVQFQNQSYCVSRRKIFDSLSNPVLNDGLWRPWLDKVTEND